MNQNQPTPEQAFNTVAQIVTETPTKVGNFEMVNQAIASLQVLKEVVERDKKAREIAMEQIPGVVPAQDQ